MTESTPDKELDEALKWVDQYGDLKYPVGEDRACLNEAAKRLAPAYRSSLSTIRAQEEEIAARTRAHEDQVFSLNKQIERIMRERDEAIGKYHAEIHEGRKRCEGIVSIAEDAAFRLGKAEGLENAVSILNGCEEAGRTARLEIEHRLREMKS